VLCQKETTTHVKHHPTEDFRLTSFACIECFHFAACPIKRINSFLNHLMKCRRAHENWIFVSGTTAQHAGLSILDIVITLLFTAVKLFTPVRAGPFPNVSRHFVQSKITFFAVCVLLVYVSSWVITGGVSVSLFTLLAIDAGDSGLMSLS